MFVSVTGGISRVVGARNVADEAAGWGSPVRPIAGESRFEIASKSLEDHLV